LEAGVDVWAESLRDGETVLRYGPNGPGGAAPELAYEPKGLDPAVRALLNE
jgi:hypothetical protein